MSSFFSMNLPFLDQSDTKIHISSITSLGFMQCPLFGAYDCYTVSQNILVTL